MVAATLSQDWNPPGCVNVQETYSYDKRLQPNMLELGTSSAPSSYYCLVFNYYLDQSNPTSCATPSQGRWLSPDPVGGDPTNPQTLNRYAYVLNNPTTLTDPSGLYLTAGYACFNVFGTCAERSPLGSRFT
jgi:uncharacterized protein RhaS with RHS repeats